MSQRLGPSATHAANAAAPAASTSPANADNRQTMPALTNTGAAMPALRAGCVPRGENSGSGIDSRGKHMRPQAKVG